MAFPFTGRIEMVWLLIVQTTYSYYFVLRLRKGLPRLLGLLPLVPPSLLVPWRAPTATERVVLSFLFLWMVNTKLLLLAWDMGPAADPFALSSFPRFFFTITSSMHLKRDEKVSHQKKHDVAMDGGLAEDVDGRKGRSGGSIVRDQNGRHGSTIFGSDSLSSGLVRRNIAAGDDGKHHNQVEGSVQVTAKGGGFPHWVEMVVSSQAGQVVLLRSMFYFIIEVCFLRILLVWKHLMGAYVLDFVLAFYLYFGCLFLFEGAAAIPACLLGTELRPQFNKPFLADSLTDFWGRRWNLLVNNLLRVSTYEPVLRFLTERKKPTAWERAIASAATFLVSGLMHDVFCFYGSRTRPTGELTAFFMLNGLGTIVEGFLFKTLGRSRVPRLLRWAYTMSFLNITAHWLFFPPFIRTGLIDVTLEELRQFIDWILGPIIGHHKR